jgi:hypothetical protein
LRVFANSSRELGMLERMRPIAVFAALAAVLALAACGSTSSTSRPHRVAPPNARLQRDLARAQADLARLRRVTAPVHRSSLMGTPAIQAATGAFLDHLDTSSIPLRRRNRLIDHAAAAVSGVCGQCFQMLEAARPIPEIAHPNA